MKTYPLYLNGEFVTTEKQFTVNNPATGQGFAQMSAIDGARMKKAVADAQAAFAGWRALTAKARGEYLHAIANELEKRKDEIAKTITLENGKPLAQSAGELGMTLDHLHWFAEEARRGYGRIIPHQTDGKRNLVVKGPIGVVGAISPWNFPLVLSVRKIAPALAAGCPVILKPASYTPLSNVAFAEACHAAKLPKGVFQLVAGSASAIAREFLENPFVRKISFTGSTEVGRELIAGAAAQVKLLSLELGGLNPVLVFDDADLEKAVDGTMLAKFRNTGQSCIAANRIYVQRGIHDRFVERLVEKTKALKVGDGLEPDVQIGAMIDANAIKKAEEHIEDAVKRGARLLCGGKRLDRPGHFFPGTVLAGVPKDSLCMKEETFAPVASVAEFESESEAFAAANSGPFGLAAYVFTRDLSRAFRAMDQIEAGMIGINDGLPTTTNAPFGGVKQSGWGRELGSEGLDAFLETKHVSIGV
ncbi:MAG TPA: NAD-dependent succinate-semialdehyde dehydrogenase [Verrucomicrobiae bacterium]|jgi:succinate-semialdehyde dehydrogenase/glutarate-semialdehyde dehydrogenase|nr:NAD-dependent succinate-semialdehyde dehydrogenase [Verrucomicrobiae bacterium]